MLKRIKAELKRRKQQRDEARYFAGYDYAAGELLRNGREAFIKLNAFVHTAQTFGAFDNFDKGVQQALRDYAELRPMDF